MPGGVARAGTLALVVVLLAAAALSARMLLGARQELARADQAAAGKDGEAELRHLRRAMAYYLPGSPWVRAAHDRLLRRGQAARARGDRAAALLAFGELRGAILRLRGPGQPYGATLPQLDRAIAELSAPAGPARAARLARLRHPEAPRPGWALLGVLGFLVWVGGAFGLLFCGLRPDARPADRRFWVLLGVVAAGVVLFVLGLGNA